MENVEHITQKIVETFGNAAEDIRQVGAADIWLRRICAKSAKGWKGSWAADSTRKTADGTQRKEE